ncbi:MAG TPA: AAA family ATPase, partial [Actinomycetota bacterium]|nr:AAA family ATPase [Actinomycetota bacterium]
TSDGRLLVVEGEAGVGKTRLVEEVLGQLAGAVVLSARCFEDEAQVAYGPIADALRAATVRRGWSEGVPGPRLADAARLVPELAPSGATGTEPPTDPGARRRFLDSLAGVLVAALAGARPGVLFVDDMQWADEASVDGMAHLVRRLAGTPVLVVWAWRTEDVAPESRLRRIVADARREGTATTITLGRLGRDDVAELAAGSLDPAGVERLYAESEGLPLFCVEYLAAFTAGDETTMPEGVRDLLASRLARVGEVARQVLAAVALVGRPADADVLREVGGRTMDETVSALEELSARRLVVESPPGSRWVDLAHEKMRELVLAQTAPARARLLHGRSADALARRARGAEERSLAPIVAAHHRAAGRDAEAAEWFARAASAARDVYAHAEALSHLEAALALGHPDPAAVHESMGDVLTLRGEYADAVTRYQTAAALAPPERLSRLEHRLASVYERRGDLGSADRHLEAALESAAQDPARRARVLADRSLIAHRRGDAEAAWSLALDALSSAEADGDPRAVAQAHNVCGVVAGAAGRTDDARDHLTRSLEAAERLPDPAVRIAALNNLALNRKGAGELASAIELTERALRECAGMGDRHRQAALHSNLADLLHAAGRRREAEEQQLASVRLFAELGEREGMEPAIWKLVEW